MEEILISNDASKNCYDQVEKDLEWGIANVGNVATSRCMYKVPRMLYVENEAAYTPRVISIGPNHYGRNNLSAMQSMKMRVLRSFLETTGLGLGFYVQKAQGWEEEVRGYYEDKKDKEEYGRLDSAEFVQMILLDGIFIVEFIFKWSRKYENTSEGIDALLMEDASLKYDIIRDLMLLDNQLPFFVLEKLGDHYYTRSDEHAWVYFLTDLFKYHFQLMPTSADPISLVDSSGTCNTLHLVDFIHKIFLRNVSTSSSVDFRGPKLQLSRSASELHEAGVMLQCAPEDSILTCIDFEEKNGILKIPRLLVTRDTYTLFRNIIAYEQSHREGNVFRSYVILMDCLINTSQDVQLLVDLGIIENCLGEIEHVCTVFNNLYKMPMMDSSQFHFTELCGRLNKYSRDPWHKFKAAWFRWKWILRRDYFSTPWSILSLLGAMALLGLTVTQVACLFKGDKCR